MALISYTNSGQKRAIKSPENIITIRETCFDVNCYLTDIIDWQEEKKEVKHPCENQNHSKPGI